MASCQGRLEGLFLLGFFSQRKLKFPDKVSVGDLETKHLVMYLLHFNVSNQGSKMFLCGSSCKSVWCTDLWCSYELCLLSAEGSSLGCSRMFGCLPVWCCWYEALDEARNEVAFPFCRIAQKWSTCTIRLLLFLWYNFSRKSFSVYYVRPFWFWAAFPQVHSPRANISVELVLYFLFLACK